MANVVSTVTSRHVTVLPSAARTAAPDTMEFDVPGLKFEGLHVVVDVTAIVTAPSITVTISGVDRASGKVYTLLAGAAVTTVSTNVYKIGPGLTASANAVANDFVPSVFRVSVSHANGNSITYSVGAHLVG